MAWEISSCVANNMFFGGTSTETNNDYFFYEIHSDRCHSHLANHQLNIFQYFFDCISGHERQLYQNLDLHILFHRLRLQTCAKLIFRMWIKTKWTRKTLLTYVYPMSAQPRSSWWNLCMPRIACEQFWIE